MARTKRACRIEPTTEHEISFVPSAAALQEHLHHFKLTSRLIVSHKVQNLAFRLKLLQILDSTFQVPALFQHKTAVKPQLLILHLVVVGQGTRPRLRVGFEPGVEDFDGLGVLVEEMVRDGEAEPVHSDGGFEVQESMLCFLWVRDQTVALRPIIRLASKIRKTHIEAFVISSLDLQVGQVPDDLLVILVEPQRVQIGLGSLVVLLFLAMNKSKNVPAWNLNADGR